MFHFIYFHNPNDENGYMSNWYMRDFTIDDKTYCCAEQYMMEHKALLFADFASAKKIMQTNDPKEMQVLGRGVANFAPVEWDGCKQLIVYHALMAKFGQNPDLCGRLITTGTATPVECSRSDKVWGIGLGISDPDVANPNKWKGQNLLGFTLQAVRSDLTRKMVEYKQHIANQ